jgi:PKD repeat protein
VTRGTAPLDVQFNDTSTNSPASWSWKFGDGGISTSQNPVHEYTDAGTYTVSLTAKNTAGSNITKTTGYITVISLVSPLPSFTTDVRSGQVPLTVRFTDTSLHTPTSWVWSFGDGASSTEENPAHTYTTAGSYTITLTVANAGGSRSTTETGYITTSAEKPAVMETTVKQPDPTAVVTLPVDIASPVPTPAGSEQSSSMFIYIVIGIIVIAGTGIAAFLYFRRPPGGGHHSRVGQL